MRMHHDRTEKFEAEQIGTERIGTEKSETARIETDRIESNGEIELVDTPSNSGKGQKIARCPRCRVAVWSHYAYGGIDNAASFVRVGTLEEPDRVNPDVHIFTSTKQRWVELPAGVPSFAEYYVTSELWTAESLARRTALEEQSIKDRRA